MKAWKPRLIYTWAPMEFIHVSAKIWGECGSHKKSENALEKESVKSVQQEYKKLRATLRYSVEPARIGAFKHISADLHTSSSYSPINTSSMQQDQKRWHTASGKMTHSNNNICNPYILQFKVTIVTKYLFLWRLALLSLTRSDTCVYNVRNTFMCVQVAPLFDTNQSCEKQAQ